nr:MAG TPA: SIR2 family protein [Caudoviricetes sp.]
MYGEELNEEIFGAAEKEIEAADMLIVGGTSLIAYPAAALLHYF